MLNHPGRPVVPDSETALNHRDRGVTGLAHNPQGFVIELVALVRVAVVRARRRGFEDLQLIIWCALSPQEIADVTNLGLGNEGPVQALKLGEWYNKHHDQKKVDTYQRQEAK